MCDRNAGDGNTGDRNAGYWNTGYWNTGHRNTGDRNAGDWNAGDRNTGDRNAGDGNTGHGNTGHWNTGSYSSGCFNTIATRTMFNEICTQGEIDLLAKIDFGWYEVSQWIDSSSMTAAEKANHPSHVITGGFLRQVTPKQAWKKCPDSVLKKIIALPHFNADVFKDISGIDVRKKRGIKG